MPVVILSILGFFLGFVGSMPLAGPIAVLVVARAVERRYVEARRLAYGAAIAEGIYAAVAYFGFASFLARHKSLLPLSHAITAVVLFVVGFHFVRWRPHDSVVKERAGRTPFVVGFTISALNPTLLVTWSAVVTAIYSRQLVPFVNWYAFPFGAAVCAGVAAWFVLLVAFFQKFSGRFPSALVKWAVRAMGMLLIAISLWSAVDLLRKR